MISIMMMAISNMRRWILKAHNLNHALRVKERTTEEMFPAEETLRELREKLSDRTIGCRVC